MGVPGLTTFIDENQQLLKDFKLHDVTLIIDGNNLYHFLYYYFQVSHHFGGDYDKFAEKCTLFFSLLAACNIRPYVVFDGAYDKSGMKLKTALKRAADRIQLASSLSHGGRGKILPILAQETFRTVVNQQGVPHVTCNFEADHQIAALAVQWNCPVLTNDSDFFIYNIPSGVILLDYMNLKLVKKKDDLCYMNVQIYYVADMMKEINTNDAKVMALFATLLGNDLINGRNFEPFFTRAHLPKKSKKFQSVRSSGRISQLLSWLCSICDFSNALSVVLSFFSAEKQERIKDMILVSINGYTDLNCELDTHFSDHFVTSPVKSSAGYHLPDWFLDGIRKGDMPVRALNIVTLRHTILLAQVEVMSEVSTYQCSLSIRQFLYAMLLSVDVRECDRESFSINEHDRETRHLKCKVVKPLWCLSNRRRVPCLAEIPQVDIAERRTILLDVLNIRHSDLIEFPLEEQLIIATIIFWAHNANPKITASHVEALLVCCIKLGILRCVLDASITNESTSDVDLSVLSQSVLAKLDAFDHRPQHNHAVVFDGGVIHAFSQFQSCLQAVIHANQLLLLPFPPINLAETFNGTFLYNFCRELHGRKDPELYVDELFCRGSPTSIAFAHLRMKVRSLLKEESLLKTRECMANKRKRKKTKETNQNRLTQDETEILDEENGDGFTINCDLSNKFSCLDVEDS